MRINRERLWEKQHEVGAIGAVKEGGVSRFAWTPEYKEACGKLMGWMEEIGLEVRMDTVGNIFGRYEGREELPAILCGSHFDTVPNGGYFDGLTGIMAALEAVTIMKEEGYKPRRPIEIVAFINEEASQFLGGTFGSKAMCGTLPEDYADTCCHRVTGEPLRRAMTEFGMGTDPDRIGASRIKPEDYFCFIEVHIEQGRYLLDKGIPLSVVSDIAGIKQFYIELHGVSCHAGGMAMKDRHDTLQAAAAIAVEVERLAMATGNDTRSTVGYIESKPGEHNIIANCSVLPVDYREADDKIWNRLYEDILDFVEKECGKRGLTWSVHSTCDLAPAHCNRKIMEVMEHAAEDLKIPHNEMVSFPCHDAVNMERILPIGMIFVRSSNGGLSHCPEEYTTKEDLGDSADVLLGTLKTLGETEKL
ncbi:MAG: M20 family metallo-hydrolase [Lachnospiraceae bacterium]|nr:M20 family metallo-hydrolase [Lachnospiraceae bacterium]